MSGRDCAPPGQSPGPFEVDMPETIKFGYDFKTLDDVKDMQQLDRILWVAPAKLACTNAGYVKKLKFPIRQWDCEERKFIG